MLSAMQLGCSVLLTVATLSNAANVTPEDYGRGTDQKFWMWDVFHQDQCDTATANKLAELNADNPNTNTNFRTHGVVKPICGERQIKSKRVLHQVANVIGSVLDPADPVENEAINEVSRAVELEGGRAQSLCGTTACASGYADVMMDILMKPQYEHVVRRLSSVGTTSGLDHHGKLRMLELLRERGLQNEGLTMDLERLPVQNTITEYALKCMNGLADKEVGALKEGHNALKMLELAQHMKTFSGAMVCANSGQYPGCMPQMFTGDLSNAECMSFAKSV